jgi:hypothetical protein
MELEKKMRQLDPSFAPSEGQDFRERLDALEKKVNELLATQRAPAAPTPPVARTRAALPR